MVRRQQEMTAMEELGAIAEDRSRIYWLLAGFYLQAPEPALLDQLRAVPVASDGEEDGIAAPLAEFRRSLAESPPIEDLHRDYVYLFLGLREGGGPPPPYESLHREGRLLGQGTEDVMAYYRRWGISLTEESVGPEDHLGLELKFLALLCLRESEAWRDGDGAHGRGCLAAEQAFLAQHIRSWVPDYCCKVQTEARTGFYRNVAGLTAAAIARDASQVDHMLAALDAGETRETNNQGGLQ